MDKQAESTNGAGNGSSQEPDPAAIFAEATVQYADQLLNVIAVDYMRAGKPKLAIKYWADCKDSPSALFNLGVAHQMGLASNGEQAADLGKALDYYQAAATKGHPMACYNLAVLYLSGDIPKDSESGLKWMRLAAEKGIENAQNYLKHLD